MLVTLGAGKYSQFGVNKKNADFVIITTETSIFPQ
jgi:hypothetical protein